MKQVASIPALVKATDIFDKDVLSLQKKIGVSFAVLIAQSRMHIEKYVEI